MHFRPKTKHRLLILLAITATALGLLAVAYGWSRHRNAVALRALREEAMVAYNSGNFEKSVGLLQNYVDSATEPDADAQFALAKSRIKVPLPNGKHLFDGIRIFKQYLETMRPGDAAAQHELLRLYVQANCNADAGHLADDMLARNPADVDVLWQKMVALVGEHHPNRALVVCRRINEIEPLNLPAQLETLELMGQTNVSPEEQIAHAEALRKAHEGDPRFEVLLADAYAHARQEDQKRKWLAIAAGHTPPDTQFVLAMVSSLDGAALFNDAAGFLARAADVIPDPPVQRLYIQRLWQNSNVAEIERRLNSKESAGPASDGTLEGYRALALFADGKNAEAQALVDALSRRSDGPASAWAIGLGARYKVPAPTPSQRVAKYEEAVHRDPENPVLRVFLAEAYLQTGEGELAIHECNQAAELARSWATPFVICSEALLAGGRNGDAVATAQEAQKRSPGRYDTETTLARAEFSAASEAGLSAAYAANLPRLELIQKTWHDPQTLGMYVCTLARSGKTEQALSVVKSAIAANPPLPADVLTNLAVVAETEQLNVGTEVLDIAQRAHGLSPEIAYARARALLEQGKQAEGWQLLVDSIRGHENQLPWRIVLADYREMSDPAHALNDWIALGDQYAADLFVQQTILHAQSRVRDREFWSRTIDRVRVLTGDQGISWRVERGRWLLNGELSERDKAEAVNLLSQVTHDAPALAEPHRLLALAMQKAGNIPGAIIELTAAADANPGDPIITRELVDVLIANNRSRDALPYLDKLAQRPRLDDQVQAHVVRCYLSAGQTKEALELAQKMASADPKNPRGQALLGEVYSAMGDWVRAEQAALLWRERSMGQTLGPDIQLAQIYLHQPKKDAAAAVRVLARHISPDAPSHAPLATELYARALVLADRAGDATSLLKPLLADSDHWRKVWLDLAVFQKDAPAARAWIETVAGSIPKDANKENLDLAMTWYNVGIEFDAPTAFAHADKIIQEMGSANATMPAAMLSARMAHARGDAAAAEKYYRQALQLDPRCLDAMNDLAYELWLKGSNHDLLEARNLSQAAIAGRPTDASYYDTLARIQSRAGDRTAAIGSFHAALQKDPASVEAMIGLADLLWEDPATRGQAKELVADIARVIDHGPRLSSVLRKQYQTVRDAITNSQ